MSGRSLRPKRKAQAGPVGDEVSGSARQAIIIFAEGPFWVITGNMLINLIQKRKQTTHRDRVVYNDIKSKKDLESIIQVLEDGDLITMSLQQGSARFRLRSPSRQSSYCFRPPDVPGSANTRSQRHDQHRHSHKHIRVRVS
jgi:hypothetical protein